MPDLDVLQKMNALPRMAITQHAKNRLFERNISISDVSHCISVGEIIKQYEDDRPFPSCLILGKDNSDNPLHIVVSNDENFIYVITAYHPDPTKWSEDFRIKKEV